MQDTRCEMQDAMVGSAKTLLGDGGKRFGPPAICAAKYRLSDDVMCKCCNTNILVMVSQIRGSFGSNKIVFLTSL
jgi:hypothetical protein